MCREILLRPSVPLSARGQAGFQSTVLCKDALFSHRTHTHFVAITLKYDLVSRLDAERVTDLPGTVIWPYS